ncbi:MAG TPA: hypothetical protein VGH79_10650 [Gaiellaceae bacterium]|jgi:hypothetical protein
MPPESEFDEVVRFVVPPEYAEQLCLRLRPNRLSWLHRTEDDGDLFVVATLRIEIDDLALLLRDVQAWSADSHVPYVDFVLDGRSYELRAPAGALAA